MKYIITKQAFTYMFEHVTLEHSLDGVAYDSFEAALEICNKIDGAGVTNLWS